MKLIAGLGNPGEKYKGTRHNIGADVTRSFAKKYGIGLRRQRYSSHFGEGRVEGEDVKIILPFTYMNLSGEAVRSIVRDKKIALSDILAVCDDADLEPGSIRIRARGSSGGHRGVKSIIESLGSESFARLRIGIGKDGDLKDHVLSRFGRDELAEIKAAGAKAEEAILCWLTEGAEKAMNVYNAGRPA